MFEYRAQLIRVHDGDTLWFDIDLGFYMHYAVADVRLAGLNAPELATDQGKAALAFVNQWFAQHGTKVTVRTVKVADHDKQEKYGRWLAHVIAEDGASLNEDLVSSGNAVPYNP